MQNYAIVLGGLERVYMKKLALYLKERMEAHVRVEILENWELQTEYGEKNSVWVGSANFIECFREKAGIRKYIILSEENEEDETHLFPYQSREKLYRGIRARCCQVQDLSIEKSRGNNQEWIAVTTDGPTGALLAFSVICAQILGKEFRVLYVNLSECCGMEELFSLEWNPDLCDLFLELRKGEKIRLDPYIGKLEQTDYLMPVQNPMILHEVNEEDMKRFLGVICGSGYERVVFAVGNTFCGCDRIFASASKILHLTKNGIANECAKNAWKQFIARCRPDDSVKTEEVPIPEITGQSTGLHLIDEWLEGTMGRMAERYLETGREEEGGTSMAGDQGASVW